MGKNCMANNMKSVLERKAYDMTEIAQVDNWHIWKDQMKKEVQGQRES